MNLKDISTKDLIKELEVRKNVKSYDCGLYSKYEVQIKRKYSQDRGLVKLPNNYKLLVISDF
ncbi:hypothetical protein SAMN02745784_01963 [Tissierella praeacuta DSM 18095]|uniref:Uncharacterized protein n=1 Tax=Tissierella praeacuta DSM 18095 TaxID=1123404 RepID=A0A1M4WSY7_9FIRM|nr:hypothetical protein [Tissierella praeacuta]TCU75833.1 hypothetical protein EV204_103401 [Tissierella praeacuta]SHE84163.1 hypothetical protein SAMN02745784_01963 [Tissierella praeacuta DSM 18095]SUP00515.1 Uncharacterised protein [Tissierella praeacuta]